MTMRLEGSKKRLCIYFGQSDRRGDRSLAEVILEHAREEGLAGASAFTGVEGFGASGRIHMAHILRRSDDLPVVVQIIDAEERIRAFLPIVEELVGEGLMTLDDVNVVWYRGVTPPALDDAES
jgi:PII-like signaling protein